MKASDLMIGDWVIFQHGIDKIVDLPYIFGKGLCASFSASATLFPVPIEKLKPIPLTPEILEKNGFKIDKNEAYCKRYIFACNLNKIPQTVVEFSFYGEGVSADTLFKCWTKPESCDGENSIHICDLKSVHQLQHALRLCGISKEIVL